MTLHWAEFYKGVYALPSVERPDDETIADDVELDRWYEAFTRQRARGAARNGPRVPVSPGRIQGSQKDIPTLSPNDF